MKYKVVIDVEVNQKEAELWFWECAMQMLADDARHGDETAKDKLSYEKFKDIKERYELGMIENLQDGLQDFLNNAGMKNAEVNLHRMWRNKIAKSYKITTDNTI